MKKTLALLLVVFSVTHLWAQEKRNYKIPLIGDSAPSFTAETTKGTLDFPSSLGKSWKILFSHPQDYTPVCSSEIIELAHMQKEFEKINTRIVVVSTDKLETHKQWVKSLEELKYKDRATERIKFPLVDDNSKAISKLYGMIHTSHNSTKSVRGVFIISPENIIEYISFYPMNVGRNMEELKRTVMALQTAKEDEAYTPANWKPGDDLLIPFKTQDTKGVYDVAWFMTFKSKKPQ